MSAALPQTTISANVHSDAYYARIYHGFQPLFRLVVRVLYGVHGPVKQYHEPVLILSNHTTDLDFAVVASCIQNHLYFVCSDHITAMGAMGRFFEKYFHPIAVPKGGSKYPQVMDLIRRIRHGSSVLLFCEGRLSHNGKTTQITPAAAKLAKAARCKVVTFRTEGGFFIEPRWQTYLNLGRLFSAGVVHEYSAAEVSRMSVEEMLRHIREDLSVDAYRLQKKYRRRFYFTHGVKDITQYYDVCPRCHSVDTLSAKGMKITCRCGFRMRMDAFGFLHSDPQIVSTLPQWENLQLCEYRRRFEQGDFFRDEGVTLYSVQKGFQKKKLAEGTLAGSEKGFFLNPYTFSFSQMMLPEILNGGRQMEFTCAGEGYLLEKRGCLNKYRDLYRWALDQKS